MDGMDGKVNDTALRHGQSLPFVISLRQQDASAASVIQPTHWPSDNRASRSDRNERIGVPNITGTLRQQALDELLNDLREYRAASPAFRPYWRKLAMHDIARFKREFLVPERRAFEAAVARQQRRAA
jgi:hypothetical protein